MIEEAKRRGFVFGNSRCLIDGEIWDYDGNPEYTYHGKENALMLDASCVFYNGKWADIIEEPNLIDGQWYEFDGMCDYLL